MRRVVVAIGRDYELHFEEEEVSSAKNVEKLLNSNVIDSPGMLINAVISNNFYKGLTPNSKKAEMLEKKLNKEFNDIKVKYYEENGILEKEDVDWKKINNDLLVLGLKNFSKYVK